MDRAPARRPDVIAFDVLETLFPLQPLEWRFREAGVPRVLMLRWFDHLLRDAFALAASGTYLPFPDLARGALKDVTGHQVAPAAADAIIGAVAELDPRPDAAAAVEAANAAGARVVVLSNGTEETTRALLTRAGLAGRVERVLSADGARCWKPAPAPYLMAARTCGVEPGRVALVTAHGWDVHGACRAGLVTGWSSQLEGRFPPVFDPPDVSGPGLPEVVEGLAALPR